MWKTMRKRAPKAVFGCCIFKKFPRGGKKVSDTVSKGVGLEKFTVHEEGGQKSFTRQNNNFPAPTPPPPPPPK